MTPNDPVLAEPIEEPRREITAKEAAFRALVAESAVADRVAPADPKVVRRRAGTELFDQCFDLIGKAWLSQRILEVPRDWDYGNDVRVEIADRLAIVLGDVFLDDMIAHLERGMQGRRTP